MRFNSIPLFKKSITKDEAEMETKINGNIERELKKKDIEFLKSEIVDEMELNDNEKELLKKLIDIVNIGGIGLWKTITKLTGLDIKTKVDLIIYFYKNLTKEEIKEIHEAYINDRPIQVMAFIAEEIGMKGD